LFEDSILSDIVKNQESRIHDFEAKAGDLSKLQKSNYSKANNTTFISKGKGGAKGNTSPVKANNPTSLELIKKVCEEFGLTRREVFEIHSQYKAMTIPYERTKDEGSSINDDYFDALKKTKHPDMKNVSKDKTLNESAASPQNLSSDFQQNEKLDGIKLDYFAENCTFLNGVHPEVKTRLFKALGIDTESRNSVMRWEEFVELYCI
jgi:bacterioferritin (cytochrome b1)